MMVIISKTKATIGNFILMLVAYAGILRPTLVISHSLTHTNTQTHSLTLPVCPSLSVFLGVVLCEGREESGVWF